MVVSMISSDLYKINFCFLYNLPIKEFSFFEDMKKTGTMCKNRRTGSRMAVPVL